MKFNLPNQLHEADKFLQNPFVIFEIHNFMDDSDYDALVQEIKSWDDYKISADLGEGRGEKKKTSYTRSDLGQIELPQFKKFVTEITSRSFFQWFAKTHLPYYKRGLLTIYVSKPKNIFSRILRRINRILRSPFSFYYIEVENSVIKKGTSISPHTDAPNKRLSLVFYLSERGLPEQMRTNLGTIFYGISNGGQKWSKFNTNLLTKNETTEFLKSYQPTHISHFRPNACSGFIKNDISWHSVAENKYDYDRKTIVINMMEV